ncbi:glycosyltransferase family 4 protein [Aeromicrobium sp. CF4.19]|uniref:glycosyltransferase family 4 protein n=1 Tax=Aeromicrobium sp. CF4.19 TaxID=3373082 RepID=UPI003EE458D1
MKVAIITESFLPQTNGVVHTVLRVVEHLQSRGDEVLVIAPDARGTVPATIGSSRVVTVPAWSFPGYADVRVATGRVAPIRAVLRDFAPDVVHLASPFALGWRGAIAARSLDLPIVAVYQTDVPGYACRYGLKATAALLWRRVRDIHGLATLTLVPSTATQRELEDQGVRRIRMWRRGVDSERFAPEHRSHAWRRSVSPAGEQLVGFVGRLAPEKQAHDLLALRDVPGVKLVIIGDGPERDRLQKLLPHAHFTGMLHGDELARAMASLDVVVNTSETETFCQVVQEALASGVPVVASAAGGPLDLVDHSRTGWLYAPGDLDSMVRHVKDLTGDESKRAAFGRAARRSVVLRGWRPVCSELVGHYATAVEQHDPSGLDTIGLRHLGARRTTRGA